MGPCDMWSMLMCAINVALRVVNANSCDNCCPQRVSSCVWSTLSPSSRLPSLSLLSFIFPWIMLRENLQCKVRPPSQQNQQQWLVLFRPNLSPSKFFGAHGVHDFEDPSRGESIVIKDLQGEYPCNIFSVNVHYYTFGHSKPHYQLLSCLLGAF